MSSDLKLNALRRSHGAPAWPVTLMLVLGVGLVHLWLLAAAPAQLSTLPGPALKASALLQPLQALQTVTTAPAKPSPSPGLQEKGKATPPDVARGSSPQPKPAAAVASLPTEGAATDTVAGPVRPPDIEPAPEIPAGQEATKPGPTAQESSEPAVQAGPAAPESGAPAPTTPNRPTGEPAAGAPPATPVAIPGSARLNYQLTGRVRGFEYTAEAQLEWQQDGQRYQTRGVVRSFPLPSRSQTSVGEIGPQGLSPRRFSDRSRTEVAIHFQPELGRIVFSNNSPEAVWQSGVQDRLSVFFQLAALIGGDPARFEPGATLRIATASQRSVEPWDFAVVRTETLNLPIGEQPALLLRREPRHLYDQTLELWFAPQLGYLPVRIVMSQANGDRLDQRLVRLEKP